MNPFETTSRPEKVTPMLALLGATALHAAVLTASLGLLRCPLAAAGEMAAGSRSRQVTFSDLDLSTQNGRQAAQDRVHQVARTLCSQVEDELDLSHQANYVACVDNAVSMANARLSVLVKERAQATLARNSVK